jgi:hypothetical protein
MDFSIGSRNMGTPTPSEAIQEEEYRACIDYCEESLRNPI